MNVAQADGISADDTEEPRDREPPLEPSPALARQHPFKHGRRRQPPTGSLPRESPAELTTERPPLEPGPCRPEKLTRSSYAFEQPMHLTCVVAVNHEPVNVPPEGID